MADINTAMLYVLTNEDETLHYNLFSAPFMAHFGEGQFSNRLHMRRGMLSTRGKRAVKHLCEAIARLEQVPLQVIGRV